MSKTLFYFLIYYLISVQNLFSQSDTSHNHISAIVTLDSFVVTAAKKGFDQDDFIRLMREDKSFYQAFHNLRFVSHRFENKIEMSNKKGKIKGGHKALNHQTSEDNCRTMKILHEEIQGNYYKRKRKHKYYTGRLLEHLFFTEGRKCESRNAFIGKSSRSGMDKHIYELKKLVFSPGDKADVPMIGKKTAIFEKEMMKYYNYSISAKTYKNSFDCYVFTVELKDEFRHKKEGKTVIKFLETYFDRKTFQVIARKYSLSHSTPIYDFDVSMNVQLGKHKGQYIPELIEYDGRWDIPAKAPEIGKFRLRFFGFGK